MMDARVDIDKTACNADKIPKLIKRIDPVLQDPTATYIVQYMLAGVLFVSCIFINWGWMKVNKVIIHMYAYLLVS